MQRGRAAQMICFSKRSARARRIQTRVIGFIGRQRAEAFQRLRRPGPSSGKESSFSSCFGSESSLQGPRMPGGLVLFDFVQAVHEIGSILQSAKSGFKLSRSRLASGSISSSWSHISPRSPGKELAQPCLSAGVLSTHLVPHLALLCDFGP